jgi:glutamyl-tRNA synthetase
VADVLTANRDLALAALAVEREGVDNPRKDLRKWSDFRSTYAFFFPTLFEPVHAGDERLGALPEQLVRDLAAAFTADYRDIDDAQEWFGQIRDLATRFGFAPSPKEYKRNPESYPGSIREASQLIRVALTGSTRSRTCSAWHGHWARTRCCGEWMPWRPNGWRRTA